MHYRDRGACFKVRVSWGGEGGRLARELFHAAKLDFIRYFLLSIENVGRTWPHSPVPRSLYFFMLRREFATRN